MRKVYRRQQDDSDWEWPFDQATVQKLGEWFELVGVQGILGFSKFGLPFYLVPGMGAIARFIARKGMELDQRVAVEPGLGLWNCWHIAMVLRKRSGKEA